ncbi:MAG: hypothetical protein NZ528_08910 [Caldilineales bacterium]|nr:hypothetical protein [Caldilineales bacterium]MDW8318169.1 hypothetical protein [Anaerolineae bacterium]
MSARRRAWMRPPDASFAAALGQRPGAPPIDVSRAQAQHRLVADALRAAGAEVTLLPPAPGHPDACFVQDVALVLPELSILGRPAEPSRQGEVALFRPHLPPDRPTASIEPPGTLEWGDVLRVGQTLYVGQSARTNAAGTAQLAALVAPLGLVVEPLPVLRGLHLLSGLSYLGRGPAAPEGPDVLVAWPEYAGLPAFAGMDVVVTPPEEEGAANCLALGATVIVPAGHHRTAAAIWHRGFRVLAVPIGEFAKADGGVTCLSVVEATDLEAVGSGVT